MACRERALWRLYTVRGGFDTLEVYGQGVIGELLSQGLIEPYEILPGRYRLTHEGSRRAEDLEGRVLT